MPVSGYASRTSVKPGGSIDFHLSADLGDYTLTIQRLGASSPSKTIDGVKLVKQPDPLDKGWEGFGWPKTYTLDVPTDDPAKWATGIYYLKEGDSPIAPFVVLPTTPGATSKKLFQVAFLTHQAYNIEGGKSLYRGVRGDRAQQVSFDRPSGLFDYDLTFAQWLQNNGHVVEFCSSIDLHTDPTLLSSYDCLISVGHDEYWTWEMCDNVERFVANGGNVIVLSGNTCYRQVRLDLTNDRRMMVCYKDPSDPVVDRNKTTVAFAQPPVNRPPNTFLGAGFDRGAMSGPAAAFEIYFPSHPFFEGLFKSSVASSGRPRTEPFMTYETDAAAFTFDEGGYPRVTGVDGTPLSTVVLAGAELTSWTKPGWATMTLLTNNGRVFHGGTTEWVERLSPDPIIARITSNVLRLLGTRNWDWELIGHANLVQGMTACEGKLFVATSENKLRRRYPVGADIPWMDIGHANDVKAMAGDGNTLFDVTKANVLWWRTLAETEVNWTEIGSGPAGGTRAMAIAGGAIYAVANDGFLYKRPVSRAASSWSQVTTMPADTRIKAMASYNGILLAATTENRLVRTNFDFIEESTGWADLHHCNFCEGLAVIDGMLFVATTENKLWRIDLRGLYRNRPATSEQSAGVRALPGGVEAGLAPAVKQRA